MSIEYLLYIQYACMCTYFGGVVNNDGGNSVLLLLIDHIRMPHGGCFEAYK